MEKQIHFDFVVSEFEAEAIFGALNREICDLNDDILDVHAPFMVGWYRRRLEMITALKAKMLNKSVDTP